MTDQEETGLATVEETGLDTLPTGNGFVRMPQATYFGTATKEPRLTVLKDAGVKPGSFYLNDDAGVTPFDKFLFFPTPSQIRCYGKNDGQGKTVGIRAKVQGGWRPDFNDPEEKKWSDLSLTLILVPLGNVGITAAIVRTYRAVDRIWDKLPGAAAQASNAAAWAARGPAYAEAAKASHWFGRFQMNAWVEAEQKTTNKKESYDKGYGVVMPTAAALVPLFNDYVASDAFTAAREVFAKIRSKMLELPKE